MQIRRSEPQLETTGKVLRCVQACFYVVCGEEGEEGRKQLSSVGLECVISRTRTHTRVCAPGSQLVSCF